MTAYDERSLKFLESAAVILCGQNEKLREMLQGIYDLGRVDGAIAQCDRAAEWVKEQASQLPEKTQ